MVVVVHWASWCSFGWFLNGFCIYKKNKNNLTRRVHVRSHVTRLTVGQIKGKKMSSWLAFASVDSNESDSLLNLVLNNRSDVVRSDQENHSRFWFKDFGELGVSLEESPVIQFYPPRKIADHLWTIGRFMFPQSNLQKKYPQLNKIKKTIKEELQRGIQLWNWKHPQEGEFNYYLEGSIKNHDYEIYGMPSSVPYLRKEGYFIEGEETVGMLDTLRKTLALRGVTI